MRGGGSRFYACCDCVSGRRSSFSFDNVRIPVRVCISSFIISLGCQTHDTVCSYRNFNNRGRLQFRCFGFCLSLCVRACVRVCLFVCACVGGVSRVVDFHNIRRFPRMGFVYTKKAPDG